MPAERKIKVLHFYKTSLLSTKGGGEVFLDTLCKSTADHGIDNTVLSLADHPAPDPIALPKYKIVQARQDLFLASTGFSLAAFSKLRQLAKEADIVHYHFPNPFADVLHLLCGIRKPTVVTYHSDIIKQKYLLYLYRPLMRKFLGSVDAIVATSPNYLKTSDVLQSFEQKVKVIPIGIDKADYPPVDERRVLAWAEKLPRPFFLFVGAMRYYKGLHIALEAIKGTDIQLVLAGIGGVERDLKAYAAQHGMDNVHFLGPVSDEDKVALLSLCYGFIFPSHLRSEAFGISLLEAAAYGKPSISCEIGTGTSFVNVHNETGLVIPPSSPEALRKSMQFLLENPDKALAFGAKAKERYSLYFTADKQAEQYCALYRTLAQKS